MIGIRARITQTPGFLKQIGCVLALSGGLLCNGASVSWSAVLPKIMNDTSIDVATTDDTLWIISSYSLTTIFVPVIAGVLMEYLGSRRLLTILTVPAIAFTVLIAYAPSKVALILGRMGIGFSGGMLNTITIPFTAELVTPEIRGLLSSILKMQLAFGVLLMTIMAKFLDWHLATLLTAIPLIPVFFLLFLVPESPFWLAKHGRHDEALKALSIRGSKEEARKELEKILKGIKEQPSFSTKDQFVLLKLPSNYKPVLIVIAVYGTVLMGGMSVVLQYAVFIFEEANIGMDPFTCTLLLGAARLLSSFLSLMVVDLVGRRPLFLGTSLICILALVLCSIAFFVPAAPNWIIMVTLLVFILSLGMGASALMPLVMSEIIPTPVRSIGVSFCLTIASVLFFVGSVTFLPMVEAIGWGYTFLTLAAFDFIAAFIFWWQVPETQGRNLVELQNLFVKPQTNGDISTVSESRFNLPHQNWNEDSHNKPCTVEAYGKHDDQPLSVKVLEKNACNGSRKGSVFTSLCNEKRLCNAIKSEQPVLNVVSDESTLERSRL